MRRWCAAWWLWLACLPLAAAPAAPLAYRLGMTDPAGHRFEVRLDGRGGEARTVLSMPVWTPGYYQRMPYADRVGDFEARDASGRPLAWRRQGNRWLIDNPSRGALVVRYRVTAERDFVGAKSTSIRPRWAWVARRTAARPAACGWTISSPTSISTTSTSSASARWSWGRSTTAARTAPGSCGSPKD